MLETNNAIVVVQKLIQKSGITRSRKTPFRVFVTQLEAMTAVKT